MKSLSRNIVNLNIHREIHGDGRTIPERFHCTQDFINRLGLYAELDNVHNGCVNCLEWSEDGRVLASGSDDVHVSIWEPYRKKHLIYMSTGHHGNIFTVKFMPNSENRVVITGAADGQLRVHDIVQKELMRVCTCHTNRVKRAVVDPNIPFMYWSAGEDGMIIQHDMRENHTCSTESKRPRNVMVDLKNYLGSKAEAKCLAIDPVRSDYFAVGANDPYVRIYDRRMIKLSQEGKKSEVPFGAAQYFVPGHLPSKIGEYKRKYRSLASTYVSYSPNGKELLANLGGEQIYIFPVMGDLQRGVTCLTIPKGLLIDPANDKAHSLNGCTNGYKNGTAAAYSNGILTDGDPSTRSSPKIPLPPLAEAIKIKANEAFGVQKYAKAIHFYNEALKFCPKSAILSANRAAALVKRNWDGDMYAALKDCQNALRIDPDHYKAHMRMCRCLVELRRYGEAQECLSVFKSRFPSQARETVKAVENDLAKANSQANTGRKSSSRDNGSTGSSSSSNSSSASAPRTRRHFLIHFQRSSSDRSSNSNDEGGDSSAGGDDDEPTVFMEEADDDSTSDSNSTGTGTSTGLEDGPRVRAVIESVTSNGTNGGSSSSNSSNSNKRTPILHEYELEYKAQAVDYKTRFCGHCNTTTDIKEANFFGDFIVAGSDDGSFFVWDKETTNIVKIVKGDESIVNCLQPHPMSCCLATSGIESVVRIWTPLAEDDTQKDERTVTDVQDAALANQRRMNSNPFEVILMNMGYRVNGDEDASDEEPEDNTPNMQCNPT